MTWGCMYTCTCTCVVSDKLAVTLSLPSDDQAMSAGCSLESVTRRHVSTITSPSGEGSYSSAPPKGLGGQSAAKPLMRSVRTQVLASRWPPEETVRGVTKT